MKTIIENKNITYSLKTHFKETIILAAPVSIGQLGHIMLGVVDSFMVGRLGAEPLAAAALANGLFFLVMVLGIGMSHAITVLIAIAKGEEKHEYCGVILRQSLIVNVVFSIGLTLLVLLAAELIVYLNQEPIVAELTKSYLQILSFSILPFMVFQTYRQFVEGLSDTKPPMYVAIVSNFINFFVNWVLVYGNLGMPALGLDGAGFATLSTRIFMALAMMIFVIKSKKYSEYDPGLNFKTFDLSIMKKIINIGLPSGVMYALEVGAFAFAAVIIGWLGSVSLAAHQIAINLASISYMVVLGISSAATIRVGNALGRKDILNVKKAGYSAIILGMGFMFFTGLIFIIFNNYLPTLYIDDKSVIALASSLLIIAALFQLSDGAQAVGMGILKGLTDVKFPMLITLTAYWFIALPIGYVLAFHLELDIIGVWIGLLIGLTAAASLFIFRFYRLTKKLLSDEALNSI
ncbi:MAG: MATE family efflux transporter [Ignavibacteriae bacterium]|nr:MATE family efflux transporter [Ignavibacteriota bacterium]